MIEIGGSAKLRVEDVFQIANEREKVKLSPTARDKIQKSHKFLSQEIAKGKTHYGINTGFGILSNVKIPSEKIIQLQSNIIKSHATGLGEKLAEPIVRAMMVLRVADLSRGHSGVSLELIELLLNCLNSNITPVVPCQGSVGASGDLAPLAHLALVLIGMGEASVDGKLMSGAEALKKKGLKPHSLQPKEGLALINGTQFMSAHAVFNLIHAEHLCELSDAIGAMSTEAIRGTSAAFDEKIHHVKPHPGQKKVAERLLYFLSHHGQSEISKSHAECERVQDPYSFRCMPQVHGVSRDILKFVRGVLETEINSVTDNPLIFADEGEIISGGNFHGQYVSFAMDALAMAVAELGSISHERVSKLVNSSLSGLPIFLIEEGGLNSGFMMVQVAAASIVSENKTLCHPASVDSIPTNVDKEDHVSMGAWAARKAERVVNNSRRILAIEMMMAAQGIDLLRPLKSSPELEKIHSKIREYVEKVETDRTFYQDIEKLDRLIHSLELIKYVESPSP